MKLELIYLGSEKLRARSCPCTYRVHKSSSTYTEKRVQKFGDSFNFQKPCKYFTEMSHYCFIGTSLVHL